MTRTLWLTAAALGAALLAAAPASAAETCASEGKVRYLCGPANVEDLVQVPGGRWIIASGMVGPGLSAGRLYLIDSRARTSADLAPDVGGKPRAPYAAGPGAPDLAKFAPHGVALRQGADGRHILYVVNHGGRESIEVFEVDARGPRPVLRWIGCVLLPDGASGNAVAPLPGGGFVATKFQQAGDPESFQKMAALKPTGALYVWKPSSGFKLVPGSEMSGANGVEASPDGRWIFANAWPEKRVVRFDLKGRARPVSVKVDFLPDNLRRGPDGKLVVAGQASDMKTLLSCSQPHCPHAWTAVKLDPATMRVMPLLHEPGTDAFSDATAAIQVGRYFWVGTYRGDRVAIVRAP